MNLRHLIILFVASSIVLLPALEPTLASSSRDGTQGESVSQVSQKILEQRNRRAQEIRKRQEERNKRRNNRVRRANRPATVNLGTYSSSLEEGPIEFSMKVAQTPEEIADLRNFSPKKLREQQKRLQQEAQQAPKQSGMDKVKHIAVDFAGETAMFYVALGIMAGVQLTFDHATDPAALQHYIDANITDPMAYASFAGFVAGNRGFAYFMSNMGLTRNFKAPGAHLVQPTQVQRIFERLVGPMGMSFGMIASTLMHELWADESLHTCAKSLFKKDMDPQVVEIACEEAYETWTVGGKMMDYAPDIFSMVGTVVAQGALLGYFSDKALHASQSARNAARRVVFRGLSILLRSAPIAGPPPVKFLFGLKNLLVFLEVNHLVLPLIERPFEQWRQSRNNIAVLDELQKELGRTESNGWVWKEKDRPQYCSDGTVFLEVTPLQCTETQPTLTDLLKDYSKQKKKWREFVLREAYMSHGSWQEYVLNLQSNYASALGIYEDVVKRIAWNRFEAPKRPNEPIDSLFRSAPLNGVYVAAATPDNTEGPADGGQESIVTAIQQTLIFIRERIADLSARKVRGQNRDELALLKQLEYHLGAMDPRTTPREVGLLRSGFNPEYSSLPDDQKNAVEAKLRLDLFVEGINRLNTILTRHDVYAHSLDPKINPFQKIRALLGDPQPLREGVAHMMMLDMNPSVVNQDLKTNHPEAIGYANTALKSDYMLASMVCGPDPDPSLDIKVKVYDRKQMGFFERIWAMFGMDSPNRDIGQIASRELVQIEKTFHEREADVQTGLFSFMSRHATVTNIWGFKSTFRPPRIVDVGQADLCFKQLPTQFNRERPRGFDIHDSDWVLDGVKYQGLLDVVKKRIRPEVLGSSYDQNALRSWWSANVEPQVRSAVTVFDQEYTRILNEKFLPNLMRKDYYDKGKNFALGAHQSLIDEAKTYLSIVGKIHDSVSGYRNAKTPPEKAEALKTSRRQFVDRADAILRELTYMTGLAADAKTVRESLQQLERIYSAEIKAEVDASSILPDNTTENPDRWKNTFYRKLVFRVARFGFESKVDEIVATVDAYLEPLLPPIGADDTSKKALAKMTPAEFKYELATNSYDNLLLVGEEIDGLFKVVNTIEAEKLNWDPTIPGSTDSEHLQGANYVAP